MYSPSAKHAPHRELPSNPDNMLVGAEDGVEPAISVSPQKGSLYACNTSFDASVMYHAVLK
jgi:hypothetical protein